MLQLKKTGFSSVELYEIKRKKALDVYDFATCDEQMTQNKFGIFKKQS